MFLLALLLLALVAGFAAGNFFYNLALNPHSDKTQVLEAEHNTVDYDEAATNQWRRARGWLDETGYRRMMRTSYDGLALNAYVMENEMPGDDWVVIFHGYNSAARVMAEFAQAYYERGFSLLMPDARGCGASEGDYIGMGWHDRLDALDWLDWLNTEHAPQNIVLHGVSMGGATVMMMSGEPLPENVRFAVEDCGYTSAWDEFAYQLKALFGLPAFPLMHFSSAVARIRAGFWLGEASSLKQVEKATLPMLFVHGGSDQFVPAAMVEQLYAAGGMEEKQLLVVEGAGHGGAANTAPERYWGAVDRFIEKHLI